MASIAVVFEIDHAATKPGQSISVVGGHPGMGRWKPERPMGAADRQLATSPGTYPRWIMFSPLWMEHEGTALKLEYKYVKQVSPERFDWEPGPNRSIELRPVPAGSDVWIIRDSQWGGTHLTPTVLNCSLAELNSSRCKVDPNWCPKVKLPPIPKLPLNMAGPKCVRGADGLGGSFASSDIDSEDSFQPSRTDKQRQRVASSILQQLEAASFTRSPDLNTKAELESLRCENAALRAVLRCLAAGELQVAEQQRTKERHVVLRTASLVPEEVWSFVFESNSSAIEPRCSYGAQAWRERNEELACAQTTEEGFHWDWPLSRCEQKQRLLLTENRLLALEGQERLEELLEENANEREELAAVMKVLKDQVTKVRSKGGVDKENIPIAQRGGG